MALSRFLGSVDTEVVVATFFGSFFISTGILLVFSTPVFYVAWRKESYKTIRRFLIAAGATGLLTAVITANSESLVAQCQGADYLNCFDIGSAGIQLLFMVGYIITSWVKAVTLFNG